MQPQSIEIIHIIWDFSVILASEVGTEIAPLPDADAGLINGSLFDDFQNHLTSSKKEL